MYYITIPLYIIGAITLFLAWFFYYYSIKPKLTERYISKLINLGFERENIIKLFMDNGFKLKKLRKEIKKNTPRKAGLFSRIFKKRKEASNNGIKKNKEETKGRTTERGEKKQLGTYSGRNGKTTKQRIF